MRVVIRRKDVEKHERQGLSAAESGRILGVSGATIGRIGKKKHRYDGDEVIIDTKTRRKKGKPAEGKPAEQLELPRPGGDIKIAAGFLKEAMVASGIDSVTVEADGSVSIVRTREESFTL